MTANHGKLPYLRLVEASDSEEKTSAEDLAQTIGVQTSLFSDATNETLGFIEVSSMGALTFQRLLEDVQPRLVFDLRLIPNFSNTHLTRQTVFALFDRYRIRYFDVAGALGARSSRDAIYNPRLLVPSLLKRILQTDRPIEGPVLFFVEPEQMNEKFIHEVEDELPHQNGRGWETTIWQPRPDREAGEDPRHIVFISHANPQDNDVALWLASRLAAVGYDVWSDETRLIGGEFFWDSIEEVIRNKAASVIVLLSKEGHEKSGVLDEVNIAIMTERSLGRDRFVIPIRLDDLSFSEIRANLARKNVIDANGRLAHAFRELLQVLEETNVTKRQADNVGALSNWYSDRSSTNAAIDQSNWDVLIENAIKIVEWPVALRRIGKTHKSIARPGRNSKQPFIAASGPEGLYTFATASEIEASTSRSRKENRLVEAVVDGIFDGSMDNMFGCTRRQVVRSMSAILRVAWDEKCRTEGLMEYGLASGNRCWYFPDGFAPKNEVSFQGVGDRQRRRALVGRSEARGVFWHFAVEASVNVLSSAIRLKPHVVFSEDGRTPIASASRQHSLRRSFCRSWWNDRWRDLLIAMLHRVSAGEEFWRLPVSDSQSVTVSGTLKEHSWIDENESQLDQVPEPLVEVGFEQLVDDPREGLLLFGPVSFERNPNQIRIGVIGTKEGLRLFDKWSEFFQNPVSTSNPSDGRREVAFPGFEAVFGAAWPLIPTFAALVSRTDLLNAIRMRDRYQAVYKSVDLIVDKIIASTIDEDINVDIWYVVIPDEVYQYGRPRSRVPKAISVAPISNLNKRIARKFAGNSPSLFPEDNAEAVIYQHHADFHHQLKARLLQHRAVTQIVRESSIAESIQSNEPSLDAAAPNDIKEDDENTTLAGGRRMQDAVNVAWNLATTSFFKAGGRPWKVATARPGVCYIGLIFKKDELSGGNHACCGAQMFLDSGEGLVFKGAMGPWYSNDLRQFHLSGDESERLMRKALNSYREIYKVSPREVFVHGRTRFSRDELEGFAAAADASTSVTGVRITRTSDFKLFSLGDRPVKRGTTLKLTDRVGLVWTSGFVDRLNTYEGRETPNPLRVEICGNSPVELDIVLNDVMTLTKMNFNSSVYADGYPVTMRFADAIGDVLMATQEKDVPPLPFRYYI